MFEVHETSRLVPGMETGADLRGETTWTPWALPWAGFVLSFGRSLGPTVAELHAEEGLDRRVSALAREARRLDPLWAETGCRAQRLLGPADGETSDCD